MLFPLRCVARHHWIQKFLRDAAPIAKAVPPLKTKSQVAVKQQFVIADLASHSHEKLRLWDTPVPTSGRRDSIKSCVILRGAKDLTLEALIILTKT
jgi:hypothetical protein